MQERSIPELQNAMADGELTAVALCEAYGRQIDAHPEVNAIIEFNPDALTIAAGLDDERRAGKLRGPLHGVPILLKDNIDTGDRMATTAGSLALADSRAQQDAFVTGRLREAGAVILGKTNLSEWANFRGARSISGWSSRGGLTRNPYALDRSACGSSSGSGAAVAANFCAVAVGTETDGSITCPAQTNGLVGIKPTVGLISRSGIIPISGSQDTAGPMARTVTDAAILLGAMTGMDARDPVTETSDGHSYTDYRPFLVADGLRGARIGVARGLAEHADPRILAIFDEAIAVMRELGATVIDPVSIINPSRLQQAELTVFHHEYKAGLNAYFATLSEECPIRTIDDLIRFNQEHAEEVMPYFGQEHLLAAAETTSLDDPAYLAARKSCLRLSRDEGIDATLRAHKLDAIVSPTGGPAWVMDLVLGDGVRAWHVQSMTLPAVSGYPHITVPTGSIFGLPVGLSFYSTAWREPTLIRLAYAYEQATQKRRPPRFLPGAELA
ncbi:MAG: amidase [Caldilineaceae bacterium]|nr:amidase [Caldilineaceae bacterium]